MMWDSVTVTAASPRRYCTLSSRPRAAGRGVPPDCGGAPAAVVWGDVGDEPCTRDLSPQRRARRGRPPHRPRRAARPRGTRGLPVPLGAHRVRHRHGGPTVPVRPAGRRAVLRHQRLRDPDGGGAGPLPPVLRARPRPRLYPAYLASVALTAVYVLWVGKYDVAAVLVNTDHAAVLRRRAQHHQPLLDAGLRDRLLRPADGRAGGGGLRIIERPPSAWLAAALAYRLARARAARLRPDRPLAQLGYIVVAPQFAPFFVIGLMVYRLRAGTPAPARVRWRSRRRSGSRCSAGPISDRAGPRLPRLRLRDGGGCSGGRPDPRRAAAAPWGRWPGSASSPTRSISSTARSRTSASRPRGTVGLAAPAAVGLSIPLSLGLAALLHHGLERPAAAALAGAERGDSRRERPRRHRCDLDGGPARPSYPIRSPNLP